MGACSSRTIRVASQDSIRCCLSVVGISKIGYGRTCGAYCLGQDMTDAVTRQRFGVESVIAGSRVRAFDTIAIGSAVLSAHVSYLCSQHGKL